jgi:glycosyltransferase involved in cell wall biosynthesis
MKITMFSNFLNHHQLPFCLEMYKLLGENFKFVATEPIHKERLELGYTNMSELYPFTLNTYNSDDNYLEGLRLGNESDVVIIGSAPNLYIKKRRNQNKLTFHYSERIFKKGLWRVISPRALFSLVWNHTIYKNKNLYMLCASAYTSTDFNLVGAYKDKTYKWGYFPEVKYHSMDDITYKKENILPKLLWVGRFLDWKHPEHAIIIANRLNNEGYNFTLDMIGIGEMENHLKSLIQKYNLESKVKLLGSLQPEQVRKHMESSNIYLFTSDFNEGWGVVLNEAMNSGCAVVASHAIGAVPYLLINQVNGLIYKNGDMNHLYQSVKSLLDDRLLCIRLGKEAYSTISKKWNAHIAAERLLKLSLSLINGEVIDYNEGPCSKAKTLTQKYIY